MARQPSAVMAEQPTSPNQSKRKSKVAKPDVKHLRADLKAQKEDLKAIKADIRADKAHVRELEKAHKAAVKPYNDNVKVSTRAQVKAEKAIEKTTATIAKATA